MRPTPRRFPALDAAIKAKGTLKKFSEETQLSEPCYYKIQDGTNLPNYYTIMKCLEYTGLTFEEAFKKKE